MCECWKENPTERPSFTVLRETLEGMLCENEGYIDFDEIREDKVHYRIPSFTHQEPIRCEDRDQKRSEETTKL